MIRRITFTAVAAGLGLSMVAGVALAAPPIAGVGTTGTCTFVGKAKIKPALIIGGTVSPVTTKLGGKLTCGVGGTGDGATVVSGKVKGVITNPGPNANDCLGLATSGLPAFSAVTKWKVAKGSPKLLPTTTNFAATPPGSINLAGPGTSIVLNLSGINAAGGSFVGNPVTAAADTDQTLAVFTAECTTTSTPPGKGVKGFNFTGLNAPSTVTQ